MGSTSFETMQSVAAGRSSRGPACTVRTGLASFAEGMSVAEIVKNFPTLDEDAVRAVIAFAAASAEEDLPVSATPSLA